MDKWSGVSGAPIALNELTHNLSVFGGAFFLSTLISATILEKMCKQYVQEITLFVTCIDKRAVTNI